jgi:alkylated DNA repair protein (DNA oxidative demethylase)
MNDLFSNLETRENLTDGAMLLRGFALANAKDVISALRSVAEEAAFRHMTTPGGFRMSVAMTNCGSFGWVTDRRGYRYSPADPETDRPWPEMPDALLNLAETAAQEAGYAAFSPDACLINRYEPGAKMSLHQDKDEKDFTNRLYPYRLAFPRHFSLVVRSAMTPCANFCCIMVTWLSGVAPQGCSIMAFWRLKTANTRSWGAIVTI